MPDKLDRYRSMRDPARTAEPIPDREGDTSTDEPVFVIQEHHATALHWDFRLERDGVLVSWALPKGLPTDPKRNHLAVHTEDHPMQYATFEGDITEGEYGGGQVKVWDHGTYTLEKWSDREVKVVLHGGRSQGRFVLFATGRGPRGSSSKHPERNWMIHRMDAPPREDWHPLPKTIPPMLATLGTLPTKSQDKDWGYEMKWDGVRAVITVDGGRIAIHSRNGRDVTVSYPELRGLGEQLGSTQVVLDGEIVAFGAHGRPDFGRLQNRMHVANANQARALAKSDPAVYLAFDLLHLDGTSLLDRPYTERRDLLERLEIDGRSWQVPPAFRGDGAHALAASQKQQLEGVLAKRLDSKYRPGARSRDWIKVKNVRAQEVIIGGWRPGQGRREGTIGSLLLGVRDGDGNLVYSGHVGTGFTEAILKDLSAKLTRLQRKSSPFSEELPRADAKDAHWVTPKLVGEVAFSEWTGDGRLRHPAWRGLRDDKSPDEVVRES